MIVLDASVVVELLTNGILADATRNELARQDESDSWRPRESKLTAADNLSRDSRPYPRSGIPHTPLPGRLWELRHNFTAYDATWLEATAPSRGVHRLITETPDWAAMSSSGAG